MCITQQAVQTFRCPRWQELPTIPLYMDQVVIVLDEALALFADEGSPMVTSTMVNNYVKQKLVPPPNKKKYSREHLAALTQVSILKRVLSMSEITALTTALTEAYGLEEGYNRFCDELERSMLAVFGTETDAQVCFPACEGAASALNAALAALCGKLYVQNYFHLPAATKEKK